MKKKQIYMIVMNTLNTDARVLRAAKALEATYDVTVIGIGKDCGKQNFKQIIIDIKSKNNILRYFEFIYRCKSILGKSAFDALYAHDYYSTVLISWIKKKKPYLKVIYDAHELIVPEDGKRISRRDTFFYKFEKKAMKCADLIICASDERAEIMKNHYGLITEPTVIENISELPIIEDKYVDAIVQKAVHVFSAEEPILVYAGVLTISRKIDEVIDVIKESSRGRLLIIGDGPDRKRLEKMAEEQIKDRFYFTGGLPYQYLGNLLRRCDIGYISYPITTLNNIYCAPNKIYEYASVELPMVAPYNPTLDRFFSKYRIGVMRDNLKEAFDVVANDLENYKNNCKFFSMSHPWSREAQKLVKIINELLIEGEKKND